MEQVTTVIAREAESERESEDLLDALEERMTDDLVYLDVEDQPLREVVERLCADLGLHPDWSGWTDKGWPDPPEAGRPQWSPFHRVSRRPILARNQQGPSAFAKRLWEVAEPLPP